VENFRWRLRVREFCKAKYCLHNTEGCLWGRSGVVLAILIASDGFSVGGGEAGTREKGREFFSQIGVSLYSIYLIDMIRNDPSTSPYMTHPTSENPVASRT
jgi:hypothetical protein